MRMRRTIEEVIEILEKHGLRCSWDGFTSVIELLDCQGNAYQSIIWEGTYLKECDMGERLTLAEYLGY